MSPIHPRRLGAPILLGGPHAADFAPVARERSGWTGLEVFSEQVGRAAAAKLCRSRHRQGPGGAAQPSRCSPRALRRREGGAGLTVERPAADDWADVATYIDVAVAGARPSARRGDARGRRTVADAGVEPLMAAATRRRQDWAARSSSGRSRRPVAADLDAIGCSTGGDRVMIIDCHGHYTTAPAPHNDVARSSSSRAFKDRRARAPALPRDLRRRDPRDDREEPAAPAARARRRHDDLLAAGLGDGATTSATRRVELGLDARLQRPDQAGRRPVSRQLRRRVPAAAVARRRRSRTRSPSSSAACSSWASSGCNLNPDPSRRPLDRAAADRPRTGIRSTRRWSSSTCRRWSTSRASCNPNFHATGAHYINADTTAFMQFLAGRPLRGLPDAALRHPARRRRRALPLGPLPRARRHAQAAAAARARDEERLLRHLRLPPAGHRPARSR